MKPAGILIAVGGNEDKGIGGDERYRLDFVEKGILINIVKYAGGKDSRIEVITTASSIPEEVGDQYFEAFKKLKCTNIGIMNIRNREQVKQSENLERLQRADAVLFSGGDQSRISRVFRDTEALLVLRHRYLNENFVIAGTSAGAMAMSNEMIMGGSHSNTLQKGGVIMGKGLCFVRRIIFDTHFIHRGRFGRLAEAVALHPDHLGIGLGEDTAVIFTEGHLCRIVGSGMVILFDGSDFSYNHAKDLEKGTPISLGNLIVHILANNDRYSILKRGIQIYHRGRRKLEEVQGRK